MDNYIKIVFDMIDAVWIKDDKKIFKVRTFKDLKKVIEYQNSRYGVMIASFDVFNIDLLKDKNFKAEHINKLSDLEKVDCINLIPELAEYIEHPSEPLVKYLICHDLYHPLKCLVNIDDKMFNKCLEFNRLPKKEILRRYKKKLLTKEQKKEILEIDIDWIEVFGVNDLSEKEIMYYLHKSLKIYPLIKNPTEKMKQFILDNYAYGMYYLKDLTKEQIIKNIKRNGIDINYDGYDLEDEDIQLLYIKDNSYNIKLIPHPTEKVKWAALKDNVNVIVYIENPSKEMWVYGMKKSKGNCIKCYFEGDEDIQLLAIKYYDHKDPYNVLILEYIKKPSETVQIEAIKKDWRNINLIMNPSDKVELIAEKYRKKEKKKIET